MEPPDLDQEFEDLSQTWTVWGVLKDGEVVESWVKLPEEHMKKILKDRRRWKSAAEAYRKAVRWAGEEEEHGDAR